jgi:hypothetical protein
MTKDKKNIIHYAKQGSGMIVKSVYIQRTDELMNASESTFDTTAGQCRRIYRHDFRGILSPYDLEMIP